MEAWEGMERGESVGGDALLVGFDAAAGDAALRPLQDGLQLGGVGRVDGAVAAARQAQAAQGQGAEQRADGVGAGAEKRFGAGHVFELVGVGVEQGDADAAEAAEALKFVLIAVALRQQQQLALLRPETAGRGAEEGAAGVFIALGSGEADGAVGDGGFGALVDAVAAVGVEVAGRPLNGDEVGVRPAFFVLDGVEKDAEPGGVVEANGEGEQLVKGIGAFASGFRVALKEAVQGGCAFGAAAVVALTVGDARELADVDSREDLAALEVLDAQDADRLDATGSYL